MSRFRWLVVGCLVLGASVACGGKSGSTKAGGGGANGGSDAGSAGDGNGDGRMNGDGDYGGHDPAADAGPSSMAGFEVQPSTLQTITVDPSTATHPTLTFTATLNGAPISAGWNVDRGELGTIDAGPLSKAVFKPTGKSGGVVTVRAGLNGQVLERKVLVKLVASQNGPNASNAAEQKQIAPDVPSLTAKGGIGGVGGEGLGTAVSDAGVRAALDAPKSDGSAEHLKLLYPYDGTVWPRGLLAPLLMWQSDLGGVDAIKIELRTTSGSFAWSGKFAAPAILAMTNGTFIRHPIPQDVWALATDTAGGPTADGKVDRLEVRLTVAKGNQAYGPVTQTWTVAPARLSGTIYYASYGTNLAKNYSGAKGGDGKFGGAVLSIRVGDTGPALVAGSDGNPAQCRVCHSASADGSRLFAIGGSPYISHAYALSPTGVSGEQQIGTEFDYPGLTSDGQYALTPDVQLLDLANGGAAVTITGLSDVASALGTPSFAYDGTKVAFNPMASGSLTDPRRKIVVMSFDRMKLTFTNAVTVVDDSMDPNAEFRPGWPSFTPDGALVYHQQIEAGSDGNNEGALHTRKGAKAYLAWTPSDAASPTPLNRLNGLDAQGTSYLSSLAAPISLACTGDNVPVGDLDADHADDANLNYEPTVNPIASGGYAWVVFTSRRMYGNVANIPPFCSDPRGVDLIQNITPKKLWVAALDLNGKSGADISHPAFYLPAQELLAGNTRGSWVLDPCRADGKECDTGDQCCNGYCSADDKGALTCSNKPPDSHCSKLQERCASAGDCCDADAECINGFCSQTIIIK